MWHRLNRMILVAAMVMATVTTQAITIEMVPVGDPGNAADTLVMNDRTTGYGSVGYSYSISKCEITAGQYTEFLNAVAGVDTYSLYNTIMSISGYGPGIACTGGGTVGNPYVYTVDPAYTNRPVIYVSWGDAARFCNWLANGQPIGAQDFATTEDGSYFLNGATTNAALMAVTRKPGATWVIPKEDEWYKAAYYDPNLNSGAGGYWAYPTRSNTAPGRDLNDLSGNNANCSIGYPGPIQSPYWTTIVGQFQNSASPYDTFDQGGNVREWNEVNISGSGRGLRGGGFSSLNHSGLASSYRDHYPPTTEYGSIGFRIALVPEPGSIALLLVGAISLLGYAWRRRKPGV
jgi:formylglycine-generating enzyme